jgi:hypothetical protein
MVKVPETGPVLLGINETFNVQVAPETSELGQVFAEIEKTEGVRVKLLIVSVFAEVFCRVRVWGPFIVPVIVGAANTS